jgi:glycosyltransferase involved in cell wall biosynthesis
MRITIVHGFFLPVPPLGGGATEKSWFNLGREFAAHGHIVTMISRRWRGLPNQELSEGLQHVRLQGFDHQRQLWRNLVLDFIWSWRVFFALPSADLVVVNAVALPIWLGWLKPRAGRVVLMTGRLPKGQYRYYRGIARVLAASNFVRSAVVAENPALASLTRVHGYPIDWKLLNQNINPALPFMPQFSAEEIIIGFIGRIHAEKGLMLLAAALKIVGHTPGLPPWRLLLCGPADIAHGGSGVRFLNYLTNRLSAAITPHRFNLLNPQFHASTLAAVYRQINIFCYPSIAEKGETFGVAVAEAMAAGAVPVVSNLACFKDFVRCGENGLSFDHNAPDAANQLAAALVSLLRDPALRSRLATRAQADVRIYDYATYAETLLRDFAQLIALADSNAIRP